MSHIMTASPKPCFRVGDATLAEELLDGQHQRVDVQAHARTAHNSLQKKRLEWGSWLICPTCAPDDLTGSETSVKWCVTRSCTLVLNTVGILLPRMFQHEFSNPCTYNRDNHEGVKCLPNMHSFQMLTFRSGEKKKKPHKTISITCSMWRTFSSCCKASILSSRRRNWLRSSCTCVDSPPDACLWAKGGKSLTLHKDFGYSVQITRMRGLSVGYMEKRLLQKPQSDQSHVSEFQQNLQATLNTITHTQNKTKDIQNKTQHMHKF